jgi:serine/threonine protein kinase
MFRNFLYCFCVLLTSLCSYAVSFVAEDFSYEFVENIGSGSYSDCGLYVRSRVDYPQEFEKVVVKSGEFGPHEVEVLERFSDQENFLKFFGALPDGSLSMEYCENSDLFNYYVDNLQSLPEEEKLKKLAQILKQILEALRKLHDAGYLHLDLKPENVFFAEDLNVKLGDFGFTHLKSEVQQIKEQERALGTGVYMAPEIYSSYSYSEKTDIFSIGMGIFFLCQEKMPTKRLGDIFYLKIEEKEKSLQFVEYYKSGQYADDFDTGEFFYLQFAESSESCQRFLFILNKMIEPDPDDRFEIDELLILINAFLERG